MPISRRLEEQVPLGKEFPEAPAWAGGPGRPSTKTRVDFMTVTVVAVLAMFVLMGARAVAMPKRTAARTARRVPREMGVITEST